MIPARFRTRLRLGKKRKFGRLTLVKRGRTVHDQSTFRCECGKTVRTPLYYVRRGRKISCGCVPPPKKVREAHSTYMRQWRVDNEEHVRAYARDYGKRNRADIRAQDRARYAKNPSIKKAANRRYQKTHPEYTIKNIARLRGLTVDQVKVLRYGLCGICEKRGTKKRPLHIDHCHRSKKPRGALCGSCNIGIGHLRDDVSLLKAAISYLRRHQ